jgi:hypothetical protein
VASKEKAQPIDSNNPQPGDCVSVDQLASSETGYVDVYRGKPMTARYHAASLYTNNASCIMYIKLHHSTKVTETIERKCHFEQLAISHGVKISLSR